VPNFLSRIFNPDDTDRKLALSIVTQGRIEIESASHSLELILKRAVREQNRLRQAQANPKN
jgi:hypothetical protein